jgi:uncharacterized protein YyaL (SSP411 family)
MNLEINKYYYPFKIMAGSENANEELPLFVGREPIEGKTTVYVCFDKACKLPVHTSEEALTQLPGFEPTGT